jgi:hypothetical protein
VIALNPRVVESFFSGSTNLLGTALRGGRR